MSHVFDAELMFMTGGDITADVSKGPIEIWGNIRGGMAVRTVVANAFGLNDTMLQKVYRSTDNSTYNLVAQHAAGATKVQGGYEFVTPFPVLPGKQYIKVEFDITAASTTSLFEDVYCGIIPNVPEWSRSSNFEL